MTAHTHSSDKYGQDERADATEAYGSFKAARTLFFWLLLLGLVVVQAGFWVVDQGAIDLALGGCEQNLAVPISWAGPMPVALSNNQTDMSGESSEQGPVPRIVPRQEIPVEQEAGGNDMAAKIRSADSLRMLIKLTLKTVNYLLVFSAVAYCLILLIGMKIALVGHLGGLADSGKAFFISLIVMLLILPWMQMISGGSDCGACERMARISQSGTLFSYDELAKEYTSLGEDTTFARHAIYYGRFVGLWLLTVALLLCGQRRSSRAAEKIALRISNQTRPEIEIPPGLNIPYGETEGTDGPKVI